MKIKGFIIAGILIGIAGAVCCTVALAVNDFNWKALVIDEEYEKETASYAAKSKIIIDSDVAAVKVSKGETADFEVSYSHGKYVKVTVTEASDLLSIKQTVSWKANLMRPLLNNFLDEDLIYIDLYLPKDYSGDLSVKNSVGETTISKVEVDKLEAECDTGTLKILDSVATTLNAVSHVGDLSLSAVSSEDAKLVNNTGNISIKECHLAKLDANSNVGNIGFSYLESNDIILINNVGNISGSIKGDKSAYDVTIIQNSSTKERIIKEGAQKLYAKTNLGNVSIDWKV